ncbi:P-loop containing nucleoside triphosphate hydrolase protein [Hypoxylon trugodes]|uniref:P-loop containing nucleoside triphosphate hydrolase protein n=1 Tax=Hypoxylon trugodes TaxID=326681 RepID=UPI0021945996|nr:P-loop containing nucleoside triphosphate hydrolase protein [Hypoxylon trugodes]KAI1390442.1 P-loop containing nucleoside triphosphate hydrolase protein [Hypoxylon trugodes]
MLRTEIKSLHAVPLYAALSEDVKQRTFERLNSRKCVVSTNIAETGLTIDGIVYVVDCGLMKQGSHSRRPDANMLVLGPIPQAAAFQRAGRAGRTQPGTCYRLYTEEALKMMPKSNEPGIRISPLDSVMLRVGLNGPLLASNSPKESTTQGKPLPPFRTGGSTTDFGTQTSESFVHSYK